MGSLNKNFIDAIEAKIIKLNAVLKTVEPLYLLNPSVHLVIEKYDDAYVSNWHKVIDAMGCGATTQDDYARRKEFKKLMQEIETLVQEGE
jgi:hypothetical protein